MPTAPEKHIFNARLALIAIITVIVTVLLMMFAYAVIDWTLSAREVVDAAYR